MADDYDRKVPTEAQQHTTGCQYCAVGCGYTALLVPQQDAGAGVETETIEGVSRFITPAMRNTINYKGAAYEAAVAPDVRCDLNKGNHSVRGGSQGENLVTATGAGRSTRERLKSPAVRLADGLHDIGWDTLNAVMAALVVRATGMTTLDDEGKVLETLHVKQPEGLGVKLYEYQYLENTYAATKLFYSALGTPNVAYHDRPSAAGSSPALEDVGFRPHDFSYDDIRRADLIFYVGTNPYENQSVFFMQRCVGKESIVLDPRQTATARYARETGGLHLQPTALGADPLIFYALARAILERHPTYTPADLGTDDYVLTEKPYVAQIALEDVEAQRSKKTQEEKRRASRALTFEAFKEFLGVGDWSKTTYTLAHAAEVSGIPEEHLEETVKRLFPDEADQPRRVAILYEKGLIWGFNYHNIAAVGSLGLLLGAYSEPGRLVGRVGGHQKGWAASKADLSDLFTNTTEAGAKYSEGYPFRNVTDTYEDRWLKEKLKTYCLYDGEPGEHTCPESLKRIYLHHNLDLHVFGPPPDLIAEPPAGGRVRLTNGVTTVAEPDVRLLWIIGGNYLGQTNDAQRKRAVLEQRRRVAGSPDAERLPDTPDEAAIIAALTARIDAGGLVTVHQDLFANPTTELCDLVIPAAGWGEDDFIRYNAERRLKLYERFQDMPLHQADRGEGDPMDRIDRFRHSPKPDWMIFRDIAHRVGKMMDKQSSGAMRFQERVEAAFAWPASAQVADEMARLSHRGQAAEDPNKPDKPSMLGALLHFGNDNPALFPEDAHGLRRIVHRILGKQRDDDSDGYSVILQDHYTIPDTVRHGGDPDRKKIYSNGVTTNGVMLPVHGVREQGKVTKLAGTLRINRITRNAPLYFVRAPWDEIKAVFERNDVRTSSEPNEVFITNGRFNHLWNNLFHHLRNEYVNERYPEDLPGTILEVNPRWAEERGIENGQVVRVETGNTHFAAIASRQPSVPYRGAFAMFSYPVRRNGTFTFGGYVNNTTDGYFDGINPIAALKYGRAVVKKEKKPNDGTDRFVFPEHFPHRIPRLGPTFEARNRIQAPKDPPEDHRLDWEMRERIVLQGLPRAFAHRRSRSRSFLTPDAFFEQLRRNEAGVRDGFKMWLDSMHYPIDGVLIDKWGKAEKAAARLWIEMVEKENPSPGGETDNGGTPGGQPMSTISRFERVKQILDKSVNGEDFGAHGAFWRGLTRDAFVAEVVFGQQLLVVGDGDASNLVKALRGEPPFDENFFGRMPVGRPPVPDDEIAFIRQWIDDDCPDEPVQVAFTPEQHNDYWRDFDDWAMYQVTPSVRAAINRFFGVESRWRALARDPGQEAAWVAALNEETTRDAVMMLAARQQQTVQDHYGDPVDWDAVLESYEHFGDASLPPDPNRPDAPHTMNAHIMWFIWSAFADACLRLGIAPTFWRNHTRAIVLGLMNDGLFRERYPVVGFAADAAGKEAMREHVRTLPDDQLQQELARRFVDSGLGVIA